MTDVPAVKIIEKINALKAEVRLHKEIADAREFDFHEAEKRIAIEKAENASLRELLFHKDARIAELENADDHPPTPVDVRPPDRVCLYQERPFSVSQGYSGAVTYKLDIPGELHLTTENILDVLGQIETANEQADAQFTKSDQAYQVIGALSHHFDAFEHPDVQRALDYFSNDEYDPEFLPWVMK